MGARGPVVLAGLILSGRLFELLIDSRRTLHQRLQAVFGDDEIPKFVLVADLDRRYPGLGSAVAHREIATSRTMRTWLGTPEGEVCGFRPPPRRPSEDCG